MTFTILIDPFLGHYYFIHSLSDPCPNIDKKKRINIAFSLFGHARAEEFLPRGSSKIYNFDRPILGHNYFILALSDICLGLEKNILKVIM